MTGAALFLWTAHKCYLICFAWKISALVYRSRNNYLGLSPKHSNNLICTDFARTLNEHRPLKILSPQTFVLHLLSAGQKLSSDRGEFDVWRNAEMFHYY